MTAPKTSDTTPAATFMRSTSGFSVWFAEWFVGRGLEPSSGTKRGETA